MSVYAETFQSPYGGLLKISHLEAIIKTSPFCKNKLFILCFYRSKTNFAKEYEETKSEEIKAAR